jgi:hypothetical protein
MSGRQPPFVLTSRFALPEKRGPNVSVIPLLLTVLLLLAAPLVVSAAGGPPTCADRCVAAGHCCMGNVSACQKPSCAMGCSIATQSGTEAQCNATCSNATGCSYKVGPFDFQMCSVCPNRWLDPSTLEPVILPGSEPWFPPGFGLSPCSSCDDQKEECNLGCRLAFNPSLNPTPAPTPAPPPPVPLPPAPWPNGGAGFNFSVTLSSFMVLQQAPHASSVYGNTGGASDSDTVRVTLAPSSPGQQQQQPVTVMASVAGGRWRAILPPTAADPALSYNITAECVSGCTGSETLVGVVFGDVYFCFGQSNMWLQLQYTYGRNASYGGIQTGAYDNIRLMSGDSQSQGLSPTLPPTHPWRLVRDAAALPPGNGDAWDEFSAPCYHFAEALTDQFVAAGKTPPTLGLVAVAIGGSMLEEWVTNDVAEACAYFDPDANGSGLNHVLWDAIIRPFLNMTIKGWLYYQGENSAGQLHGNLLQQAGYACLMPALVRAFRAAWSATPGTTDPAAPFGLVTLSQGDSEGAADMASFRWAQSGSYGVVPNPAMPNAFWAHGYDLADPYVNCGDSPQTKQCPGCDTADPLYDCLQPWYMGPGIHPRLKKPVGQRLAASALVSIYGFEGPVTGPTIAGCTYSSSAQTLTVSFNATLLAGSPVVVKPYGSKASLSGLSVLVNATNASATGTWVALDVASASPTSVAVDLSALGGAAPSAIKYAWGPTGGPPDTDDVLCCDPTGECVPGGCPIYATTPLAPFGGHPANPFLAQIVMGKCVCTPPQVCDA